MITAAAVLSLAVGAVVDTRRRGTGPVAAAMAAAVLWAPRIALPLGAIVIAIGAVRAQRSRRSTSIGEAEVMLFAELVSLGLSAGLSFPHAMASAAEHVAPPFAGEIDDVVRAGRRVGLATALEQGRGAARPLYRVVGRALRTGAPVGDAVRRLVEDLRAEERSRELEHARRLPVKMLFPLALLILPGFLVVTIGPTVLAALDRFSL